MTNKEANVLKVKDLQLALGIGAEKAYALMHSIDFPSMKIGKTYFVTREKFDDWLKESEGKEIQLDYGTKQRRKR